jgi:hypothetical protein
MVDGIFFSFYNEVVQYLKFDLAQHIDDVF